MRDISYSNHHEINLWFDFYHITFAYLFHVRSMPTVQQACGSHRTWHRECAHSTAGSWKSEDLVGFFFGHMDPGTQTRAIRLHSRAFTSWAVLLAPNQFLPLNKHDQIHPLMKYKNIQLESEMVYI